MNIKKIVGFPVVWLLILISGPFAWFAYSFDKESNSVGIRSDFFYTIHDHLWWWSYRVQEWAGLRGPWVTDDPYRSLHEDIDVL